MAALSSENPMCVESAMLHNNIKWPCQPNHSPSYVIVCLKMNSVHFGSLPFPLVARIIDFELKPVDISTQQVCEQDMTILPTIGVVMVAPSVGRLAVHHREPGI